MQLSGPDRGPVLEDNLSLGEVKHFFDEEGLEAERRVRAVFITRMCIWYERPPQYFVFMSGRHEETGCGCPGSK